MLMLGGSVSSLTAYSTSPRSPVSGAECMPGRAGPGRLRCGKGVLADLDQERDHGGEDLGRRGYIGRQILDDRGQGERVVLVLRSVFGNSLTGREARAGTRPPGLRAQCQPGLGVDPVSLWVAIQLHTQPPAPPDTADRLVVGLPYLPVKLHPLRRRQSRRDGVQGPGHRRMAVVMVAVQRCCAHRSCEACAGGYW